MRVIDSGDMPGVVIKSWCSELEDGALVQARNLARLPFAFRHVALMPDAHQGYGMPIGGVFASQGVVIPNAVGVDIGCGMRAVRTTLTELDRERLKQIMGTIRALVPVGFNSHKEPQANIIDVYPEFLGAMPVINREAQNSLFQIGTLGGGNHFIEIQRADDGRIWFMIHSGSRNLGKKVADYYNKEAIRLNERWRSSVATEWELAFLPIEEQSAKDYVSEMKICLRFARLNREKMADRIKSAFQTVVTCDFETDLDVHHNYAAYEHHFGRDVIIHRKGATSAKEGEVGIIPGSQGTSSYIVEGLGNRESFTSCSHGAGRRMGRREASRTLSLEAEIKRLDDKGVLHGIRHTKDLDEAPGAYKDIDAVMREQEDLVKILTKLEPIGVIKG